MKFGAIIVTYNRKSLLEECLSCVLGQSLPFFQICVVDNCSTDGTAAYLDQLAAQLSAKDACPLPASNAPAAGYTRPEGGFLVFHLPENRGGAGGFAFGLGKMAESSCDWVLIIDDDAMIGRSYMERIYAAIRKNDFLAYSGTVKTEGRIDGSHRRRIANPLLMTYRPVPEEAYEQKAFVYDISTFCGLVVKTSLIREIGLPREEYFIWFDDTEYCLRFHKRSAILNVNQAVLDHRTAAPGAAPPISWKHFYGFRNSIDIGRTYSLCPPLYLGYIFLNHQAHIAVDRLCLAFRREDEKQKKLRRYRIQVYRDVLAGRREKPHGRDERYLPGTGPN